MVGDEEGMKQSRLEEMSGSTIVPPKKRSAQFEGVNLSKSHIR